MLRIMFNSFFPSAYYFVIRGHYSAGPVIGLPAHRANPVIGPSKGLHQVSAITRELRETIGGFKRQEYDFGDTNASEFIF